ncbi:MAG: PaaI family thioesterase [Deltaproteobacteria bacterium]|nr:PaaI family thioesterase [Deltaproteobacteria bacterium]
MIEYEDLSPGFKQALLAKIKSRQPYWRLLGIDLVDVKKGWAKLKLSFSDKLVHPFGVVHGGAIFSLADSAVAMALLGLIDKTERFTTVETKINYVNPVRNGDISAESRIIHKGNRIVIGEVEVRDEKGLLIAKSIATFMIIRRQP